MTDEGWTERGRREGKRERDKSIKVALSLFTVEEKQILLKPEMRRENGTMGGVSTT